MTELVSQPAYGVNPRGQEWLETAARIAKGAATATERGRLVREFFTGKQAEHADEASALR